MEESSQNTYKRLIRSFVKRFYGNGSYAVVNYLMEQEYRVSCYDLYRLFGKPIEKDIKNLVDDRIILMSMDNLVKAEADGPDYPNEYGKKSQNFSYYIDYPMALNIIEYAVNDLITKYNDSLVEKDPSYKCPNESCDNNARYEFMEYRQLDRCCPKCGKPLIQDIVTFKTNFVEYLAPFTAMIEKSKGCESFDVVKQLTRYQERRLANTKTSTKKSDGGASSSIGISERQLIEVEMKYEDEPKESPALAMNQGRAPNRVKIPWLTKGYRDIILEHIEQERESPTERHPPGSRPPPDSPLEKKKVKIENQK